MSFQFQNNQTIPHNVRRVIGEQVDKAVAELDDDELSVHEKAHQLRKRCKKIRALLRLVRDAMGSDYDQLNAWFRDVARQVSDLRDATANLETLDDLEQHFDGVLNRTQLRPVRGYLQQQRDQLLDRLGETDELLATCRRQMLEGRQRVEQASIDADAFDDIAPSIKRVYKRGRKGYKDSADDGSTTDFHQWRKRVKYLRYQFKAIRPIWDDPMKKWRDELADLSDLIGDDHDLAVLRTVLTSADDALEAETIEAMLGVMDGRRGTLQSRALTLGQRLYTESPGDAIDRLETYWHAWRTEGQTEANARPPLATEGAA